jgi:hypothetical protein
MLMIRERRNKRMMKKLIGFLLIATAGAAAQTITINGIPNQPVVLPVPTASTLGGIESIVLTTNNWVQYIDTSGVPHLAQVAFSNLNGSAACGQLPAFTGDATTSAGSCATVVGSIGGHTVTLAGALTTTGTGPTTLAFPSTTATFTFPAASASLAQLGLNTFTKTQTFAVNTVASGSTPAFDLSLGNVQYVSALATNASPTFSNITAGGAWMFVICNNGTGGYTWTWPASVHGGITIGTTASKCSTQLFSSPDGTNLFAQTLGVVNQ